MDIEEKKFAGLLILFFAAFMALLIYGCKPREIVTSDYRLRDSSGTVSWVEYRDTVIRVEADSAAIMALAPGCPDLPEQVSQNGRVRVSLAVKNGRITADCKCKELERAVKLMTRNRVTDRIRDLQRHDTRIIREKFVPGIVKVFAWIGGAACLVLLLWCIWRLVKLYIKIKPF